MDFKSIREFLKSFVNKEKLSDADILQLNELLTKIKEESKKELVTLEQRRGWLEKETSKESIQKAYDQKYKEHIQLALGKGKISAEDSILRKKLLQVRYANLVDKGSMLLAVLFIFSHIPFLIFWTISFLAFFFKLKMKNDVASLVQAEMIQARHNSGYYHNYMVSVKKCYVYESLIRLIESLLAKDTKAIERIEHDLEFGLSLDVESWADKMQVKTETIPDIQTLKKSFHIE